MKEWLKQIVKLFHTPEGSVLLLHLIECKPISPAKVWSSILAFMHLHGVFLQAFQGSLTVDGWMNRWMNGQKGSQIIFDNCTIAVAVCFCTNIRTMPKILQLSEKNSVKKTDEETD